MSSLDLKKSFCNVLYIYICWKISEIFFKEIFKEDRSAQATRHILNISKCCIFPFLFEGQKCHLELQQAEAEVQECPAVVGLLHHQHLSIS